jgi:hypothetical protein
MIGDGIADVWERLGPVQVCVEIYSSDAGNQQFLERIMGTQKCSPRIPASYGANVVVVWSAPESGFDPGWKQIPNTSDYVHFLTE